MRTGLIIICFVLLVLGFGFDMPVRGDAAYFNQEVPNTPSKDEIYVSRLIEKLCKERGVEPPLRDGMLSAAARPMAQKVAGAGLTKVKVVDNRDIEKSIKELGGTDAAIRTQVASMFLLSDVEDILKQGILNEILSHRFTHIGIAVKSKLLPPMHYVVIILSRRPVLLEPFPRQVLPGKEYHLKGTVFKAVTNPRLLIAKPSGTISKIFLNLKPDGSFRQRIPFEEGGGDYTIELQADGPQGPEIDALFEVKSLAEVSRSKENAPYIVIPDLPPVQTEAEAEARVFSLVNSARQSANKVQLVRKGELDKIARDYAKKMVRKGFVGHVDPDGEDVGDRIKNAGLKYKYVAENVAVNETVIAAHKNLIRSPAHAQMILDNRFSQVGVGVVFRDSGERRTVYVVEIFFEPL